MLRTAYLYDLEISKSYNEIDIGFIVCIKLGVFFSTSLTLAA